MSGPLSITEIKILLRKGKANETSLVWGQGFETWVELKSIPDLQTIALAIRPEAPSEPATESSLVADAPPAPAPERLTASPAPTTFVRRAAPLVPEEPNPFLPPPFGTATGTQQGKDLRTQEAPSSLLLRLSRSWPLRITLGLTIALGTTALILHAHLRAPAKIGVWRSSGFLTTERFNAFERAATAIPMFVGTRLEFEPVNDPSEPRILVATNLPDGSFLQVTLQGIEGQMVGALSYRFETKAQVTDGTAMIRLASATSGVPPTGHHRFSIVCTSCQLPKANSEPPLIDRQLFLGPRSTFMPDLERYHTTLRQQIQLELDELRQLLETIVNQLDETSGTYHLLSRNGAATKRASSPVFAWNQFSGSWSRLQKSMESNVRRFDLREAGGVFHHVLYRRALEALTLSLHLHQLQATEIAKPLASRAREIEDTEQLLRAHITSLWAKITRAQQDLSQTSGLPERPVH